MSIQQSKKAKELSGRMQMSSYQMEKFYKTDIFKFELLNKVDHMTEVKGHKAFHENKMIACIGGIWEQLILYIDDSKMK